MEKIHQFGGQWTEEKLERLRKYLAAYTKIFASNERAKFLTTYYVDAFAGTGHRAHRSITKPASPMLLDSDDLALNDQDADSFTKGSARIALEVEPSFDNYIFVERNLDHVKELEILRQQFPSKTRKIDIRNEDANSFIQTWCDSTNWQANRAVVFLDPYGMSVDWKTIEVIAKTKAIDLWLLFPLGQGVNRLLTREHPPEDAWANKLTRFFGTNDWMDAFYRPTLQQSLFGEEQPLKKEANFDKIGEYFISRLKTVFTKVSDHSLTLRNSRNSPIFLLCFASANPKGASTAVKIADHILKG